MTVTIRRFLGNNLLNNGVWDHYVTNRGKKVQRTIELHGEAVKPPRPKGRAFCLTAALRARGASRSPKRTEGQKLRKVPLVP